MTKSESYYFAFNGIFLTQTLSCFVLLQESCQCLRVAFDLAANYIVQFFFNVLRYDF